VAKSTSKFDNIITYFYILFWLVYRQILDLFINTQILIMLINNEHEYII